MGKHKKNKPFNDEDAKMYGGQVTNFFDRLPKKKKRGRPPKKNNNRGRPKKASPPTPPPHMRKSPPEIQSILVRIYWNICAATAIGCLRQKYQLMMTATPNQRGKSHHHTLICNSTMIISVPSFRQTLISTEAM